MMKREKTVITLLFFILLGCALMIGCMGEGGQNTTAVPTPPAFQPDILDKAIVNPPAGEEGPAPFLFDFDTGNASGFEEVRADRPGASTLVLGPNASATLPIVVSSETDTGTDVRIARTDGLPEGVQVSYTPDSFTLKAGEKTRLKMCLSSSENLTVPADLAVVVWMEGAGWEVGRGFRLGEAA